MSITTIDHHPTLRHEERDALGTALLDLSDLALAGKQSEQHAWMFSAQGRA